MGTLRAILAEVVGLFVDDGSLALALVLWCAAMALAVRLLPDLSASVLSVLLLGGCVGILLANVVRAAWRHRSTPSGG